MAMTISIDDSLKSEFSDVCAEIGLSASAAFNVFAKAVVRERRIPFELSAQSADERRALLREQQITRMAWEARSDLAEGRTYSWDDVVTRRERG